MLCLHGVVSESWLCRYLRCRAGLCYGAPRAPGPSGGPRDSEGSLLGRCSRYLRTKSIDMEPCMYGVLCASTLD
ncbi:hypothetical protein MINT15_28210 [Saccharomonospora viridis]|uniref:Uncharacterized protein n=1 Tax=Saccharomonospora viridis TaxID=1852 RepID=A0A837D488_9PSEU|nr:hypothetical protein MINT15_28210 [Saccharomonospora viridis]